MSFDPTDVRNALRDEKLLLDLLSWVPGWVVMAQSAVDAILNEQEALRIERDAERRAHHQTRTVLTDGVEAVTRALASLSPRFGASVLVHDLDRWSMEAQRVLGLAVAEADKPHDGNER